MFVCLSPPVCALQVANVTLMLTGAGAGAIGMYTGFNGHGGAWPGFVVAGIGAFLFLVCLLGLLGALRINRMMLRLVRGRRGGTVGSRAVWLIVPVPVLWHCGVSLSCPRAAARYALRMLFQAYRHAARAATCPCSSPSRALV